MQNKLQELTEKIYREGITKGNAEADVIVSAAKKEAEKILEDAKKEAESIIKQAKNKAEEMKTNAEAELKLSSKQAVNALKQQITDLVNDSVVKSSVSSATTDKAFVQKIIETAVNNWTSSSDNPDLAVLLPEGEEKKLMEHFGRSAKNLFDKGLEIRKDSSIKSGFQLMPKDGSYKISFTDEDFVNFFKQYLRPKLTEMLFEGSK
jgi:V/A-type H+/Na+-transporting ATPase subunit E